MPDKELPNTENGWNLFLQNMSAKIVSLQAILNLTAGEVATLQSDAANYNYVITVAQQIADSKTAFTDFKDELCNGEPSTTAITPPVFAIIGTPNVARPGIIKRTRNLVARIKTSDGYTTTIGEDLDLYTNDPTVPTQPEDLVAALDVKARPQGKVEIAFRRQGMNAMKVEFQRKNDTAWSLAGIYFTSPGFHDEPSVPPGEPESRQYRGILIQGNDEVGNYSPSYTVVTTP